MSLRLSKKYLSEKHCDTIIRRQEMPSLTIEKGVFIGISELLKLDTSNNIEKIEKPCKAKLKLTKHL